MTNLCYKFAGDAEIKWNLCAAGDAKGLYCHWLFAHRGKNSPTELNLDGQLDAALLHVKEQTPAKDVPVIISYNYISVGRVDYFGFYVSNVKDVRTQQALNGAMRYSATRNSQTFKCCEQEGEQFKQAISDSRAKKATEKRNALMEERVAEEVCKRLKKDEDVHPLAPLPAPSSAHALQPSAHSPAPPTAAIPPAPPTFKIFQRVLGVTIPPGWLSINRSSRDIIATGCFQLMDGWNLLSAGINVLVLDY